MDLRVGEELREQVQEGAKAVVVVIWVEETGVHGKDGNTVRDADKEVVEEQVPRDIQLPKEALRLEQPHSNHPKPQPTPRGTSSIRRNIPTVPKIPHLDEHLCRIVIQADSGAYELL